MLQGGAPERALERHPSRCPLSHKAQTHGHPVRSMVPLQSPSAKCSGAGVSDLRYLPYPKVRRYRAVPTPQLTPAASRSTAANLRCAECVKEVRGVSLRHLQLHSFVDLLPDDILTCRMFVAGSQKARIRAATVRQETLRPVSGCCRYIFPLRKEPDDIDGGVGREIHTYPLGRALQASLYTPTLTRSGTNGLARPRSNRRAGLA